MPQLPASHLDISQWRLASDAAFGKLHVETPDPASFLVELKTVKAGDVSLFDMSTSPHTVTRRASDNCDEDTSYCKLSLQLRGNSTIRQDGRECQLNPGDLALYLTHRPYELQYREDKHSLVVLFPQSYLHLTPVQIEAITARPVSRDHGLGKIMVPLFEQLADNIEVLNGPHAGTLLQSALNMLVAVFASVLDSQPGMNAENLLFEQARKYIEKHLADTDLGPQSIAHALFVSVRQLHMRFAAHKTTVGAYIRTRRLERIRADLANPLYASDSIATVSARYGLHDPSQVSRAFKAEFRESPSAFRARVLEKE